MTAAGAYRDLGEAAWGWVLGQVRDDDGHWLPDVITEEWPAGDRDSLYAGIAGLAPVIAEIRQHRPLTGAEQVLADGIVARLTTMAAARVEPSLYEGLAGDATALKLLAPDRAAIALRRLLDLLTPAGWPTTVDADPLPYTDLVSGTAGVVLTAAWVGDGVLSARILRDGGEILLRLAEPAERGLDWRMRPGYRSSSPNFSHGTAGAACALAVAGHALGRADFIDAACDGVRYLLAVGSLDDVGFVVPHTLPYSTRDVEPVTWNWCHGPSGTSQLFAALALAGVPDVDGYAVDELRRRCLRAVVNSGVPRRLRPGFWDNDGRCCGTAGVGDVFLDAAQDMSDPEWLTAARMMGDALVERAVRHETGARWQFIEHRLDPPLLPPRTSWMQGAAGIAAYLLRLARVLDQGHAAPVVDRPDQWWAVPAHLRTA